MREGDSGCVVDRGLIQAVLYNADMLADRVRPILFAHRGTSSRAPENTMAAFELAAREGAQAIELDAKLTKDRKVVVFHDTTLARTTNGDGRLSDKRADELRELDAGSHFSQAFRAERIPFLEEVFEVFGKKLLINVQFGTCWTRCDGVVEQVCALVMRYELQDHIIFSSFDVLNLAEAARLLPAVPRGLLARRGWRGVWARSFAFSFRNYAALHPYVTDVTPQQVQRVHRLRRRVHVWTVNDPGDIKRLAMWGVDGIFTDDPKAALRALGRSL
jgi:glycerophosphoryl diester phosphodiesterase